MGDKVGLMAMGYGVLESIPRDGAYPGVSIKYAPPFISPLGDKPEFWYVTRPTMNTEQYRAGLKVDYWTKNGWNAYTPKQYPTAEAAYADLPEDVRVNAWKRVRSEPRDDQQRERELLEQVRVKHLEYQAILKPIVTELSEINNRRPPKPIMIDQTQYVYTGPWPWDEKGNRKPE
jgi:hypothetical protein